MTADVAGIRERLAGKGYSQYKNFDEAKADVYALLDENAALREQLTAATGE